MIQRLPVAPRTACQPTALALVCALAEARQEAARAGRPRYVHADAAAGWVTTDAPPRGECHCVYPGGRVERHAARRPRRLA